MSTSYDRVIYEPNPIQLTVIKLINNSVDLHNKFTQLQEKGYTFLSLQAL